MSAEIRRMVEEMGVDAVGIAAYDPRLAFTQAGEVKQTSVIVYGKAMSFDTMADIGPRSQEEVHRVYHALDDIALLDQFRAQHASQQARRSERRAPHPVDLDDDVAGKNLRRGRRSVGGNAPNDVRAGQRIAVRDKLGSRRRVAERLQFGAALAEGEEERAEQGEHEQPVAERDVEDDGAGIGAQHESQRDRQDIENGAVLQPHRVGHEQDQVHPYPFGYQPLRWAIPGCEAAGRHISGNAFPGLRQHPQHVRYHILADLFPLHRGESVHFLLMDALARFKRAEAI